MALGFPWKKLDKAVAPDAAAKTLATLSPAEAPPVPEDNSAKEILALLELELGAMIRQLERASASVAGGAQSTATRLSTIRQRTETLTSRTSDAHKTAETFSLAAGKFKDSAHGIGVQVQGAKTLADQASMAAAEASLNVERLRSSSEAIGSVVDVISRIAKQTTLLALNSTIEAARAGVSGRGFAVVATEVKALAVQTQDATEEIRRKIGALQQDAAASFEAVHRISNAIDAIRPVFENVNIAVADQSSVTADMVGNASSASEFIASVGDSAVEIDGVTREAQAHGASVAEVGQSVTQFAEKLKSRCAILLGRNGNQDQRKHERLPCRMNIEVSTKGSPIKTEVLEFSRLGMLIAEPGGRPFSLNQSVAATIDGIGGCNIRFIERAATGVWVEFVTPGAALNESIEDKLWSIHDENTEAIIRAMDAVNSLTKMIGAATSRGEITVEDLFDENYLPIPGTNPVQYRTRFLDWCERKLLDFQEQLLAGEPRMKSCAAMDRNGYIPVNNKYCSQPQRPGDVAWNTANSRNRRIYDDGAARAACSNKRAYLVQSYWRDMGGGNTVRMREVDVPIWVDGKLWGAFRSTYVL